MEINIPENIMLSYQSEYNENNSSVRDKVIDVCTNLMSNIFKYAT